MIDIHTHVLPEMDDGAPDLATSAAMLDMAREDGITDIVVTPHANLQYTYDVERRDFNMERAREARPDGPKLYPGCEVHLTPENVDALLAKPEAFTIDRRDCVLLELPDLAAAMSVECAVQILLGSGVRPIIAHPERNRVLQRDGKLVTRLIQLGCYFQLTAQSLDGCFGPEARSCARTLLEGGLVHFVASDAHGIDHRRPVLSEAYDEITRQYGEITARLLFEENPRALLAGERIQANAARRRNLFSSLFRRSHERTSSVPHVS